MANRSYSFVDQLHIFFLVELVAGGVVSRIPPSLFNYPIINGGRPAGEQQGDHAFGKK